MDTLKNVVAHNNSTGASRRRGTKERHAANATSLSPAIHQSGQGLAGNVQRIKLLKDEKRQQFSTLVDNLPNIQSRVKRVDPAITVSSAGGKRKSVPMSQSQSNRPGKQPFSLQESSIIGGTTNNTSTFSKQSPGKSKYPDYFYKPPTNLFDRGSGNVQTFHLTNPDDKLCKIIFSQGSAPSRRQKPLPYEAQSLSGIEGKGANSLHKTIFTRSPNSLGGGMDGKGLISSQKSVDSTDTIRAFFNQGGTKVQKARRVTEKEHERVRRVQRARENAMGLAVEAQAKHILREKKEAKNEKRYKQYMASEAEDARARFEELKE